MFFIFLYLRCHPIVAAQNSSRSSQYFYRGSAVLAFPGWLDHCFSGSLAKPSDFHTRQIWFILFGLTIVCGLMEIIQWNGPGRALFIHTDPTCEMLKSLLNFFVSIKTCSAYLDSLLAAQFLFNCMIVGRQILYSWSAHLWRVSFILTLQEVAYPLQYNFQQLISCPKETKNYSMQISQRPFSKLQDVVESRNLMELSRIYVIFSSCVYISNS